jgi:putative transposase
VTATKTWREAVAALEAARERAAELLGAPLIADLVDRGTGELSPIRVVTDNGPCYKAAAFARYIRSRPEFEHVRTRHRSPETNGVIERFYGSIKYEHLYLQEIDDGPALAEQVAGYRSSTTTSAPTKRSAGRSPAPATSPPRPDHVPIATHHQRPDPSHFLDTGQRSRRA